MKQRHFSIIKSLLAFLTATIFILSGCEKIDNPDNLVKPATTYLDKNGVEYMKCDSLLFKKASNATAELHSTTYDIKYDGEIKIPSYIECDGTKYTVTSIGRNIASKCSFFSSIHIPPTIEKIERNAFLNCTKLQEVHISSLPQWYKIEFNGESANPMLCARKLFVNGKLTEGNNLFPKEVTRISPYSMVGCNTKSISIPANVTEICDHAFACSLIESITIHDGITKLNEGVFERCPNLSSVTIPESLTEIGEMAFCNCTELQAITIPKNVAKIGGAAFMGCAIKQIELPAKLTTIESYTFAGCSNLSSVVIPGSVKEIGDQAFYVNSLKKIVVKAEVPPTASDQSFNPSTAPTATLTVPTVSVDLYKSTAPWNKFTNIVGGAELL